MAQKARLYGIIIMSLILIFAIIHLGVSIGIIARNRSYGNMFRPEIGLASYNIVIAILALAVGGVGLVCILMNREGIGKIIAILAVVLGIFTLASLITALVINAKSATYINTRFSNDMNAYASDSDAQNIIDRIQTNYQCCGGSTWLDWGFFQSETTTTTSTTTTTANSSTLQTTMTGNSSTSETTPNGNSSTPETTPTTISATPETTPNGNSSTSETTPNGNSSISETTPNGNSSTPETTPNGNSSTSETTMNGNNTTPETTPTTISATPETTPNGNSSTSETTMNGNSTTPETTPTTISATPETTPNGNSSTSETTMNGNSTTPETTPTTISAMPETTSTTNSSSSETTPTASPTSEETTTSSTSTDTNDTTSSGEGTTSATGPSFRRRINLDVHSPSPFLLAVRRRRQLISSGRSLLNIPFSGSISVPSSCCTNAVNSGTNSSQATCSSSTQLHTNGCLRSMVQRANKQDMGIGIINCFLIVLAFLAVPLLLHGIANAEELDRRIYNSQVEAMRHFDTNTYNFPSIVNTFH